MILRRKMKKSEILALLDEARHYHNVLRDEKKAIKICDKILREHPENRDALLIKAGSLHFLGKDKESHTIITKIIKRWPKHWEAYYLMGLLFFNTNENMAIENLARSIELEKTFDNVIASAQLLYFLRDESYKVFLKEAKNIDPPRYKNYMKKYWTWEVY